MRFQLTDDVRREIQQFSLRSACCHCFFARNGGDLCSLEWPNADQKRWPLTGDATDVDFCKEFELA